MAVELRMIGEPDEIARVIHEMEKVLDVDVADRTYGARSRFDVRTYAKVRVPTPPTVTVDRVGDAGSTKPALAPKTSRRELP